MMAWHALGDYYAGGLLLHPGWGIPHPPQIQSSIPPEIVFKDPGFAILCYEKSAEYGVTESHYKLAQLW